MITLCKPHWVACVNQARLIVLVKFSLSTRVSVSYYWCFNCDTGFVWSACWFSSAREACHISPLPIFHFFLNQCVFIFTSHIWFISHTSPCFMLSMIWSLNFSLSDILESCFVSVLLGLEARVSHSQEKCFLLSYTLSSSRSLPFHSRVFQLFTHHLVISVN